MTLMSVLVALIVIGVLFWAIGQLSAAFGIPAPIQTVIQVLLVVLVLIWILQAFGLHAGLPSLRFGSS